MNAPPTVSFDRHEVGRLVPERARQIIDVGCGDGSLGGLLRETRKGVEVRGIEPGPIERARGRLTDVYQGRAEDPLPAGWPAPDCVIFADVLEHFVDPWGTLAEWRARISPGGTLVVSIPNVGHWTNVGSLLRAQWDYRDSGLLDRTHLRFFTTITAVELVEGAGFTVTHFERVIDHLPRRIRERLRLPEDAQRFSKPGARPSRRLSLVERAWDLATFQVLMTAR